MVILLPTSESCLARYRDRIQGFPSLRIGERTVHAEYSTERLCSQDHAGRWVRDERPMEECAAESLGRPVGENRYEVELALQASARIRYAAGRASRSVSSWMSTAIFVRADECCRL
jgi:hypothetical protein